MGTKNQTSPLDWEQVAAAWKANEQKILRPREGLNRRMIQLTKAIPGSCVLDFGTGVGVPGMTAAQLTGATVFGADTAEAMLKIAEGRRLDAAVNNFKLVHIEGLALPFENNFFDSVMSSFALEFSSRIDSDLNELGRIMKPQGLLVVSSWINSVDENPFQSLLPHTILEVIGPKPLAHDPFFKFSKLEDIVNRLLQFQFKLQSQEIFKGAIEYDSLEDFWNLKKLVSPAVVKDISLLDDSQFEVLKKAIETKFTTLKRSKNGGLLLDYAARVCVFKNEKNS